MRASEPVSSFPSSPKGPLSRRTLVSLLIGSPLLAALGACTQKPAPPQEAEIGGPFTLTDQTGRRVTESLLMGHWTAVFFGYVSCPDVCPATMQTLAGAKDHLAKGGPDLDIVFITVDPARDTPAHLKAWLDQPDFPHPATALTGSPAEIDAVAKAYRVYYSKEGSGAAYSMAHSAAIYLMNPQGRFVAPLTYTEGPVKLAADLSAAMKGGA